MGLFIAFAFVAVMVALAVWWGCRSRKTRLPPMVEIPEFDPPEIDIGEVDSKRFIDPFSGETLRDDCETVVLVSRDGTRHDYEVNSDTAAMFRAKGLYPFREKMRLPVGSPPNLYCYRGRHGRNDLDEISVAYLSGELFNGHRPSFDLAFDDLAARQDRSGNEPEDESETRS